MRDFYHTVFCRRGSRQASRFIIERARSTPSRESDPSAQLCASRERSARAPGVPFARTNPLVKRNRRREIVVDGYRPAGEVTLPNVEIALAANVVMMGWLLRQLVPAAGSAATPDRSV
jgi:hypothetical protein